MVRRPATVETPGRTPARPHDLRPTAARRTPLHPGVPELVTRLGLPRDPGAVAAAVNGGPVRRLDLLRNDGGSVTLYSCLLGGVNAQGHVGLWHGRVEVDDAVLADGEEALIACAIGNAGPSELDGLPLVTRAVPDDGVVEVAVAVPVVRKRLLRSTSVRFEVRRARGRAVSVTPRGADPHFVDDGVAGVLTRKRSWWIEPGAWATYVT
jgi:hypothetical protein